MTTATPFAALVPATPGVHQHRTAGTSRIPGRTEDDGERGRSGRSGAEPAPPRWLGINDHLKRAAVVIVPGEELPRIRNSVGRAAEDADAGDGQHPGSRGSDR